MAEMILPLLCALPRHAVQGNVSFMPVNEAPSGAAYFPTPFAPRAPANDLLRCAAREGRNNRRGEGKRTEAREPSAVINI